LHKELAPERMAKRVPTAVAPITKSTCTNDRASITPSVRIKWPRSPVTTSWSITSPLRWQNKGRQRLGHPQRQQQCQAVPLRSKAAGDEPLSQAQARCRATGNHRIGHAAKGSPIYRPRCGASAIAAFFSRLARAAWPWVPSGFDSAATGAHFFVPVP
jgi:hypothetical protein